VRRTARQTAHEIFDFRQKKEAETSQQLTKVEVAALYRDTAKMAKDQDVISENFVGMALAVYEKIVSEPELSHCIDVLEERYNLASCFSSMSNLQVIIQRTEKDFRTWVMQGIVDGVLSGNLCNDDITKSCLSGSSTTISLCTLLQFRRQVAKFYIGSELPGLGVNTQDLIEFGTKLESHGSYRAHVSDMSGASVDMTWKARCRASSILAFDLLVELQTATNPIVQLLCPYFNAQIFLASNLLHDGPAAFPSPRFRKLKLCVLSSGHCIHRQHGRRPQVDHQKQGQTYGRAALRGGHGGAVDEDQGRRDQ
jgi:hypothetical protein